MIDRRVIQDKPGKCLTEEHEVLTRFTEYCSDLYHHESNGDSRHNNTKMVPIRHQRRQTPHPKRGSGAAVKCLKGGKSPGDDNIPAELIKNGGEAMISILTIICNEIWENGE